MTKLVVSILLCLLVGHGIRGVAATPEFVPTPHSKARLISEVSHFVPGESFRVGLQILLDENWHTYWINPGDSGAAPILDYDLSQNIPIGAIEWPIPERIEAPPLVTFGYHHEVLLMSSILIPEDYSNENFKINLSAEWLVCKEECIPATANLDLVIPCETIEARPKQHENTAVFTRFEERLPTSILPVKWTYTHDERRISIEGQAQQTLPFSAVDFFPLSESLLTLTHPQFTAPSANSLTISAVATSASTPNEIKGLLVFHEGDPQNIQGTWISAGFDNNPVVAPKHTSQATPWSFYYLWFAFLGGLILNLMPCVFPVLSIKLVSMVKQREHQGFQIQLDALTFAAGVIVSFLILAGILVVLRAGGTSVGWGFQLQSPYFLTILAFLFITIAANFLGAFELYLPGSAVGDSLTRRNDLIGAFFTGVLSVVAASPCTAPFMGAAIGVALTLPWYFIVLVFACLGLGMSSPFLIFAIRPSLINLMPKPGWWMVTLKEVMAFPLLLTAAWFIWLIGQTAGNEAVGIVLGSLVALGFLLWLFRRRTPGSLSRKLIVSGALLTFVASAHAVSTLETTPDAKGRSQNTSAGIQWIPFSPSILDSLRQSPGPIFINFTADWCLTCKVNERIAFTSPKVHQLIRDRDIRMVKADWTKRDGDIAEILAQYNRIGVPLYLFWPEPEAVDPVILPEVLTADILIKYLDTNQDKP